MKGFEADAAACAAGPVGVAGVIVFGTGGNGQDFGKICK